MSSLLTEVFGYSLPYVFECVTVKPGSLQGDNYTLELVNKVAKLVTIIHIPKDFNMSANNRLGKILLDTEIAHINSTAFSGRGDYLINQVQFLKATNV